MSALDDKISESGSCSSQTHREKKTYSVQEIADILQITVKQNLPGDPKSADYPYQALKGSF